MMSVGIIIAEIVFTVVAAILLVNIQPTVELIFGIIVSSVNTDDFCYIYLHISK